MLPWSRRWPRAENRTALPLYPQRPTCMEHGTSMRTFDVCVNFIWLCLGSVWHAQGNTVWHTKPDSEILPTWYCYNWAKDSDWAQAKKTIETTTTNVYETNVLSTWRFFEEMDRIKFKQREKEVVVTKQERHSSKRMINAYSEGTEAVYFN